MDILLRYTGQQLDEDTGLYFYKSRYYDPQLARFTQADTIVPSANTSQALNRYAYVKNNPLKFSDPSGHGWFKKIFGFSSKSFIGAAVTIGLNILAPGLGLLAAALIGSAVATAVNGGTFKSFIVGVGIGFAAGVIAGGLGDSLFGAAVFSETLKAGTATLATKVMFAAMSGAAAGAISSAVYGQNIEKGLAYGAATGAVTAGVVSVAGKHIEGVVRGAAKIGADILKGIGNSVAGVINMVGLIVDDIASHLQVDARVWMKADYESNWRAVNLKAFKSRNENGIFKWMGYTTWDKHNIHLGEDALAALRQLPGFRNNPTMVKGGRLHGRYFNVAEVMAHEAGHTARAAQQGIFYLLNAAPTTLLGDGPNGGKWEIDASRHGQYGGFVK